VEAKDAYIEGWMLILPQCSEVLLHLRADVASRTYGVLYMTAPLTLLCIVATLLLRASGSSSCSVSLAAAGHADSMPSEKSLWWWPTCIAAVLMSWPQLNIFAKGMAACTGIATGHLLDVCVCYCLRAGTALLSQLNKRRKSRPCTVPEKRHRVVLGLATSRTDAFLLVTLLLLTFLHVFLGLLLGTFLVAYSCASASQRNADTPCAKSHDLNVTSMERAVSRPNIVGPAISRSQVRVRQHSALASAYPDDTPVGKHEPPTAAECSFGSSHADCTSCNCLLARGHIAICVMLVSTALALPSAVATVRSGWTPQPAEDVAPAVSIVLWAFLLSATCSSHSCQSAGVSTVSSRAKKHGSLASQCQATKGCRFSQLVFSQVSFTCNSWILCMNLIRAGKHLAPLAVETDVGFAMFAGASAERCDCVTFAQARFESHLAVMAALSLLTWAAGCSSAFVACGAWSTHRVVDYLTSAARPSS
jgi:hypothetical protein